jgi:hypothetical protein
MIWQDILIERLASDHDIAIAMADAFGLQAGSISVVGDLHELDNSDADPIAIICERWRVEGDFALQMHVYLRTNDVIAITERRGDIEIVGRFAQKVNSACFIGDDDINPFTGLLIRGPKNAQPARLDSQDDDEGVFRLAPVPAHVS